MPPQEMFPENDGPGSYLATFSSLAGPAGDLNIPDGVTGMGSFIRLLKKCVITIVINVKYCVIT